VLLIFKKSARVIHARIIQCLDYFKWEWSAVSDTGLEVFRRNRMISWEGSIGVECVFVCVCFFISFRHVLNVRL